MRAKTIQNAINKKFDDWVKSIEDKELRKLVDKNSIITGGCITSMFQNEPVNDFDLYFTNKETAEAVANYYVAQFKKVKQNHANGNIIDITVETTVSRIRIIVKSAGVASIEGTDSYMSATYDYVQKVTEVLRSEVEGESNERNKYQPLFISSNAITLSDKIQVIVRFFGSIEEVHKNFDFIHVQNYWLSSDRRLYVNMKSLQSILEKQLYYNGSLYPIASLIRTKKFIKRGWNIDAGQYLKMCWQVSKLDLNDISVLEDQLIGVDTAYFIVLISVLRSKFEKEKEEGRIFVPTWEYITELIDKIF